MKVGIVGAGPAGSLCGSILSQVGCDVLLFDYHGAWEKPCGGGVTTKALTRYPFLRESLEPYRNIKRIKVISPRNAAVTVPLENSLHIYSRKVLNQILLDRAIASGASLQSERVLDSRRQHSQWQLQTDKRTYQVDFLIGADGVNSFVRKKVGEKYVAEDLMMTFGYRTQSEVEECIEIKFFPKFLGYLWVFPRPNHVSFGICGRLSQHNTQTLKRLLHEFMDAYKNYGGKNNPSANREVKKDKSEDQQTKQGESDPSGRLAAELREVYGALIPSLRPQTFRKNKVYGEGWALLGDAAGFVDPITCEGIYFALRSGELLAQALVEGRPASYPKACEEDFAADFIYGAELFEKFYTGHFLGSDFITRMVQTTSRSNALQRVMNAFVAGKQNYQSLRSELARKSPRILLELMSSALGEKTAIG